MIHIISLGAGVQSSTMALMAAHGEIEPMPICAIFADTGWEPKAVYEWLDQLEKWLPFPVVRVTAGNIRTDQVDAHVRGTKKKGQRWAALPYFTKSPEEIREGRVTRQCTAEYKISPLNKHMKQEILGLKFRQRTPKEPVICQWMGISRDESSRMKPSRDRWKSHRFPLAMEHGMARSDCLQWMDKHSYPKPPRSACIGCPFHSNTEWREMRDTRPDEWQDAIEFDAAIRWAGGMDRPTFLHRSCVPLSEIDLITPEDRGQGTLFGEECEGMCGV